MLKPPMIMNKMKTIDREEGSPRGVTPPLTLPFPFPLPGGILPILVGINLLLFAMMTGDVEVGVE
jgi:hypothetical protein